MDVQEKEIIDRCSMVTNCEFSYQQENEKIYSFRCKIYNVTLCVSNSLGSRKEFDQRVA